MVKMLFFAAALALALNPVATAQQATKPLPVLRGTGKAVAGVNESQNAAATPPSLCKPCAFYGGDLSPNDPNAIGHSDENTFYIAGSSTYGAVIIPAGDVVKVDGALFNVLASAAFDPMTASYDVRTGVSEGNGGTSVASGSSGIQVMATGRNLAGLYEYTIAVRIHDLTLTPGEYWFNITPTCMNTLDGSCYVQRQYASNTTAETNNVHGSWQPAHEQYLNSVFFHLNWTNWCDSSLGLNSSQCRRLSFGIMGEVQ
jgi:hypothetical protein